MNKRKNYLVVFSFLIVLAGSLVFSGCETSRVGPEVPRANPEAPAPQAIVVSSYVLDGGTGNGIANATVSLTKLDGTVVASAVTDASGKFSFNITALNLTAGTYNVSTTVTGYGYGFRVVTYDPANNAAGSPSIVLNKIVTSTPVTVTPATGGAASTPPANDAKTTTPVTVTVPPNAVPTNTQVTVASVPVVSTPPPSTAAATQNIVASTQLASPGVTTYSQPVTMSFTLPFPLPAGTQIPLLLLNTATGKWEDTGLKAIVTASGLTATVNVTKPGQYALLGDVKVTQTATGKYVAGDGISVTKLEKVLGTKVVTVDIFPNSSVYTYKSPTDPAPFITVLSGSGTTVPNNAFAYGLIQQRFGVDLFTVSQLVGLTYSFSYNLPANLKTPAGVSFPTRNSTNVIIGPPGHENESGDWVFRIEITETLVQAIYNEVQAGVFNINITDPQYRISNSTQWVWRQHNQGTAGLAGYNP